MLETGHLYRHLPHPMTELQQNRESLKQRGCSLFKERDPIDPEVADQALFPADDSLDSLVTSSNFPYLGPYPPPFPEAPYGLY